MKSPAMMTKVINDIMNKINYIFYFVYLEIYFDDTEFLRRTSVVMVAFYFMPSLQVARSFLITFVPLHRGDIRCGNLPTVY